MLFLGTAIGVLLAISGVVAIPVADTNVTDNTFTDSTIADTSSDNLVASSTASHIIKPKVVIISHVRGSSCVQISSLINLSSGSRHLFGMASKISTFLLAM